MADSPELYAERNDKYSRVIHAEMNAILTAKESLKGYTLYVWPAFPCDRCAVHIIQAGIKEVVSIDVENTFNFRWNLNFTTDYFKEAGVAMRGYKNV